MAKKATLSYGKSEPLLMDVHLQKENFDSAIYDKGYTSFIEKALMCPCADTSTGMALSTCKNCGGSRFFWVNKRETRLMMTNITYHKFQENWTEANTGTISVSARAEDAMSFMDRVTVCELVSTYIQKARIDRKNDINFSLLYFNPIEIEDIYLFNGDKNKLIVIKEGDYEVKGAGLIFKDKFNVGDKISIRYKHHPVYYIGDVLRESVFNYNGEIKHAFPLHYIAKRANLVLDENNLFSERLFDNTDYAKVDRCSNKLKTSVYPNNGPCACIGKCNCE